MSAPVIHLYPQPSKRTESYREESARADVLQQLVVVTAKLSEAATVEAVSASIVEQALAATRPTSVGLWLVLDGGDRLALVRSAGLAERARRIFSRMSVEASKGMPAADVVRTGAAIWAASPKEIGERHPNVVSISNHRPEHGLACLPITVGKRTRGALMLTFDASAPIDDARRGFLIMLALQGGLALERCQAASARADLLAAMTRGSEPEDLQELLSEALEDVGPAASACGVRVLCLAPPMGVTVTCDRTRVLQVLRNFVERAIPFTDKGGSIQIEAGLEHGEVRIAVRGGGRLWTEMKPSESCALSFSLALADPLA